MEEAPADTVATPPVTPLDPEVTANVTPEPDSLPVIVTPPTVATKPEPRPQELSPLERLADMALSGGSYTSAQLYRALNRAGITVSREELDLLYLYYGYKTRRDTTTRLNLLELVESVSDFAQHPLISQYLDTTARVRLDGLQQMLDQELSALRSHEWSLGVVVTDLPSGGESTFSFLDKVQEQCRTSLSQEPYYVGFSVMYKEMKEGFPREMMVLTLLTVAAIFLIVALTFRSLVVPILLVPTVYLAVFKRLSNFFRITDLF